MTWRTHVLVGANAVWVSAFLGVVDKSILVLLPTAVIASLLPDIDAVDAKIHHAGGGALGIFRGAFYGKYFHHRGLMHSLFVAVLLSIIAGFIFPNYSTLPYVFFAAYFSHSVIDGFNTTVGYLYPFYRKRFALLPKFMQSPVGGITDQALFFIAAFTLLLFFLLFKDSFIGNINTPGRLTI